MGHTSNVRHGSGTMCTNSSGICNDLYPDMNYYPTKAAVLEKRMSQDNREQALS